MGKFYAGILGTRHKKRVDGMFGQRMVEAVLVAAGNSRRMGFDKLFQRINGVEILRHSFEALAGHPYVDRVILVAGENMERAREAVAISDIPKPVEFVRGGDYRAASVAAGVALCGEDSLVAIHDAARPFASEALVSAVIEAAAEYGAAAPAVPVKDTVKIRKGDFVKSTPDRSALAAVQTPQVFDCGAYRAALGGLAEEDRKRLTDDCMVMEWAGLPVALTAGEEENYKITTPNDIQKLQGEVMEMEALRVGHGYDVHAFAPGRKLILGGVEVQYTLGLLGHSDADVLLHALSDALLGAVALGDIGRHFPDSDPAYKDADSLALLGEVVHLLKKKGYVPGNVDATIICQMPKLAAHIPAMQKNIAKALGIGEDRVNVKATTEENLGFTGRGEGISAHCVAVVKKL